MRWIKRARRRDAKLRLEKGEPHGIQGYSADADELSRPNPGLGSRGGGLHRRKPRRAPCRRRLRGARAGPRATLSGSIANVPGIIAGETEKSRKSAKDMLAAFDAAADKAGVLHETYLEKCPTFAVPDLLVDYARLRDLTIVPVPESYDQWYAEALISDLADRPWFCRRALARVRSNSEPSPSPGISAAQRRVRFPMRCRCSKGEEGAHRYRHQRKEARYQAFRRRTGKEPGAPRHRRRAGPGRCERPTDRRSS